MQITTPDEAATAEHTPVPPSEQGLRAPLAATVTDQCARCAARLAPDQRYCVQCGERRGAPRFPVAEARDAHARDAGVPRRRLRAARLSPNNTLIAGVATLLLAMGVGVLIGRSGRAAAPRGTPVSVVTVAGTGAGAATTPSTQAGATATKANTHAKRAASGAATKSAAAKAVAAPPPKVVHKGSPGHGPGYQNGHFTGNFFGQ